MKKIVKKLLKLTEDTNEINRPVQRPRTLSELGEIGPDRDRRQREIATTLIHDVWEADGASFKVKEGEVVCVDGHFTLAHDARVRIEK